jgi:hypothetical protein
MKSRIAIPNKTKKQVLGSGMGRAGSSTELARGSPASVMVTRESSDARVNDAFSAANSGKASTKLSDGAIAAW